MISVRAWLNNHFSGRWIGRRGPTDWLPRLLERKKHWVCVFQVSEVLESIQKYKSIYSVWALNWRKNCGKTAFRLGDGVI